MVNSDELIDLDPAMEDILSVWGKDPTAQNIERYFGTVETLSSTPLSPEPLRLNQSLLQSSKELEGTIAVH